MSKRSDMGEKIKANLKGPLVPSRKSPMDELYNKTNIPRQEEHEESLAPVYSERVTLPLSSEQRDLLDTLAKRLQKQRPERAHDFNRSSILRAFISLLDEDSFKDARVSTESQLVDYLKKKFSRS